MKKARKWKLNCILERIKSEESYVEENDCAKIQSNIRIHRHYRRSWRKVKQTLLYSLINDIGKMETVPRNLSIVEVMINKMKKRRRLKTTDFKDYIKLINQLSDSDRVKEICMEEM